MVLAELKIGNGAIPEERPARATSQVEAYQILKAREKELSERLGDLTTQYNHLHTSTSIASRGLHRAERRIGGLESSLEGVREGIRIYSDPDIVDLRKTVGGEVLEVLARATRNFVVKRDNLITLTDVYNELLDEQHYGFKPIAQLVKNLDTTGRLKRERRKLKRDKLPEHAEANAERIKAINKRLDKLRNELDNVRERLAMGQANPGLNEQVWETEKSLKRRRADLEKDATALAVATDTTVGIAAGTKEAAKHQEHLIARRHILLEHLEDAKNGPGGKRLWAETLEITTKAESAVKEELDKVEREFIGVREKIVQHENAGVVRQARALRKAERAMAWQRPAETYAQMLLRGLRGGMLVDDALLEKQNDKVAGGPGTGQATGPGTEARPAEAGPGPAVAQQINIPEHLRYFTGSKAELADRWIKSIEMMNKVKEGSGTEIYLKGQYFAKEWSGRSITLDDKTSPEDIDMLHWGMKEAVRLRDWQFNPLVGSFDVRTTTLEQRLEREVFIWRAQLRTALYNKTLTYEAPQAHFEDLEKFAKGEKIDRTIIVRENWYTIDRLHELSFPDRYKTPILPVFADAPVASVPESLIRTTRPEPVVASAVGEGAVAGRQTGPPGKDITDEVKAWGDDWKRRNLNVAESQAQASA